MSLHWRKNLTRARKAVSDMSYLDGIRRAEGCSQDYPSDEKPKVGYSISRTMARGRNWLVLQVIRLAVAILTLAQRLADRK